MPVATPNGAWSSTIRLPRPVVRKRLPVSEPRVFPGSGVFYAHSGAAIRLLRALANLALGAQVIGPLALILIGLFFCQSRAEVILGVQTSLLSLFGLSFSDFLL